MKKQAKILLKKIKEKKVAMPIRRVIVKHKKKKIVKKYEIYVPPPGKKFGWIPKKALMLWKKITVDKNKIQKYTQKDFPLLKNKGHKWGVIFFLQPHNKSNKKMVPYIIEIPEDFTIPYHVPFYKLPVWNEYKNKFVTVKFEREGEEEKIAMKLKQKMLEMKKKKKKNKMKRRKKKNKKKKKHNLMEDLHKHAKKLEKQKHKKKLPHKSKAKEVILNKSHKNHIRHGDNHPKKEKKLFNDCQKGLEMMSKHPSEELKQELKSQCNIEIGGKINKYIPLIGSMESKLGAFVGSLVNK